MSHSASNTIPPKIGRYIVREALGRGAMGTVYLATDPVIDRPVAIKLIQSTAHWSTEEQDHYRERFSREAKAAGRLLHPGIVTVFDAGQTEEGLPFLVMEYVKGRTLKKLIGKEDLSMEQLLQLGSEILEALECAHAQGIVHRDLKPANIIVTDDLHAKIMDFGIAHLVGSDLTQTGEMIGTPHFMAPEQIDGKPVDLRTDIFSFGIVFYLMLTGEQPFVGDTFTSLTYAIVNKEPIPPEQVKTTIPESLSRIVLRCIRKNPDERYASTREIIHDLIALQEPPLEPGSDTVRSIRKKPGGRARPGFLLKSLLLILAISVPAALYYMYLSRPSEAPPAEQHVDLPTAPVKQPVQSPPPQESEASLFAAAQESFQLGKMEESKASLEEILKTNPSHPEASQLLKRITNHQLFSEATIALQNEEWDRSRAAIDTLLENDPEFPGAKDILRQLKDQQFYERLPLSLQARHNHTFGGCDGTLIFGKFGITYRSEDHGKLSWRFSQIVELTLKSPNEVEMVAVEKGNKKYKFSFPNTFPHTIDWQRYQKLWSKTRPHGGA